MDSTASKPQGWGDVKPATEAAPEAITKTEVPAASEKTIEFNSPGKAPTIEDRLAALEGKPDHDDRVSKLEKFVSHLLERAGIEPDDPRLG